MLRAWAAPFLDNSATSSKGIRSIPVQVTLTEHMFAMKDATLKATTCAQPHKPEKHLGF